MASGSSLLAAAGGPLGPARDAFASLIATRTLSPWLVASSLFVAVVLGAFHALSPGHGKTMMAGYLVGSRGRPRDAVVLGLVVTLTHTSGVFVLGVVTLYAANFVTPERLYPWMALLSGVLIVAVGLVLIWTRTRGAMHGGHHQHHGQSHDHDHVHPHDHGHHHHQAEPGRPLGRAGLIAMGVSGGIVPCPSALVVLLAAISLHRVLFGLLLITAFSAGLAAVLTGIGVALAGGLPLLSRLRRNGLSTRLRGAAQLVPVASALVVTISGVALTAQALQPMLGGVIPLR
jgi:ABC-type nickel/cobalt efflux system permease component RcnA